MFLVHSMSMHDGFRICYSNSGIEFPSTSSAIIAYAFSVRCTASQKIYLDASEQVNGFLLLHIYETSITPVPQHALLVFSNPARVSK